MERLAEILDSYRALLAEVDCWFDACLQEGETRLACRRGCHACCRGLFEISLLDACLLQEAFNKLPADTRHLILARCWSRLAELQQRWPGLVAPYLLNGLPEEEWTAMPEDDPTPCPLLDDAGLCHVYEARPLVCRLHGLPNVDLYGEDFEGTVCTLHPGDPRQVLTAKVLHWNFRETFRREAALLAAFTEQLGGVRKEGYDTFIPLALLADYRAVDWRRMKARE